MSLAANALVTLEEATAEGLAGTSTKLTRLINTVSARAERYCDRVFRLVACVDTPGTDPTKAPLELLSGSGSQLLRTRRAPIVSVERVRVGGSDVTSEVSIFDADKGLLYRPGGWPQSVGTWADLTGDPRPDAQVLTVELAYTAGFSAIPDDLKSMALAEVEQQLEAPVNSRLIAERTPGGWQRNFGDIGKTHNWRPESRVVLDDYRRTLYS